jgi:ketosteroid isomerase-like protein
MIYRKIITNLIVKSFENVQNHKYEELLVAIDPKVTHHFAGDHSLGGTRHDKEALKKWFERVGRVLPNLRFEVKDVIVKGMPWNTLVIARWVATCKLENGEPYVNPGVHFIKIKWGKAYSFDVYEDSLAVSNGLKAQAISGIKEAVADKIES